jgi:hypothetical protein
VLAETLDCGHRAKLGPAIVQCSGGKGAVIYIGSSVGAVYEEARMKPMRVLFHTLGAPWLAPQRSYEMDYLPGVTPHVVASHDTLLLHLLPDTGN